MSGRTELTRALIEDALDLLGHLAVKEGIVIDLAIYGGSCLILATDVRNASGDVDAVYLANADTARRLATSVARSKSLPDDWINQAVKQFAPPRGNPTPNLLPFRDYPRQEDSPTGLRVLLPTPEYLLAMKLLSNRAVEDTEKVITDSTDAIALMKITGIKTYEQLVALMRECYPAIPGIAVPEVSPRIRAKIEGLVRRLKEADPNDTPTWNAGRGSTLA